MMRSFVEPPEGMDETVRLGGIQRPKKRSPER